MLSKQTLALHKSDRFNKIRFFVSLDKEITSRYDAGVFTVDYFFDPIDGRGFLEFVEIPASLNAGSIKRLEGSMKKYIALTPSLKQSFEQFINAETLRREIEESKDEETETNLLLLKNWFQSKRATFVSKADFEVFKKAFLDFIGTVTTHTSKIFQNIEKDMENFGITIEAQHIKKSVVEVEDENIMLEQTTHILKDSNISEKPEEISTNLKKVLRI